MSRPASRQASTIPRPRGCRPCCAGRRRGGHVLERVVGGILIGAAVGRDVALVAVRPDVHQSAARPDGMAGVRGLLRRSAASAIRSALAALSPENRGCRRRSWSGGTAKFDHTAIGRPSVASARTTHSFSSIDAARGGGLVGRRLGVELVGLELAVARRVGEAWTTPRRASPARAARRPPDRLRDALGGEVEDARVEGVAAQRRVAGVVERPDRPGGGVGVGGRDHQPLGRDPGGRDPAHDLLGERERQPAEVGLHHRELAPVLLHHQRRARTRVWMPSLGSNDLAYRLVSGSPTIWSALSRSWAGRRCSSARCRRTSACRPEA